MRRTMIAIATAVALGAATTAAMAQHRGGGSIGMSGGVGHGSVGSGMGNFAGSSAPLGGHVAGPNVAAGVNGPGRPAYSGGFPRGQNFAYGDRDRDHDWDHHGHWRGRGGWYGGLYAFGGPWDYDDEYYYGADSCYQLRWVPTPYGYRWRQVWVCD